MQILAALNLFLLLSLSAVKAETINEADKSAVRILAYFMIGQDYAPEASVTIEQFSEHLELLERGQYNVMPLPDIIQAWERKQPLPPKTVAITFDGGHKSILTHAAPLLKKYNFPFTVFIASERASKNSSAYLNWRDIKKLSQSKIVTIGIHPSNYNHYEDFDTFKRQLNSARAAFREQLGKTPDLLSFPFGEYSDDAIEYTKTLGINGFGQQSGVAYAALKSAPLPRFTMNEFFADETRMTMILNALPMDVSDVTPIETVSSDNKNAHTAFGFTAPHGNEAINCYSNGDNPLQIDKVDKTRIEMRSEWRVLDKRLRINCTETTSNNQIRWFGFLAIR